MACSRTPATVERLQAQYRLPRVTTDLDELLSWEPQAAFGPPLPPPTPPFIPPNGPPLSSPPMGGKEGGERVWEENYAGSWKTTLEARGFANQVAHFFEGVRSRQQPLTSGWEALKTQLLLEAMVARAKE